jgi:cytidylate kinase
VITISRELGSEGDQVADVLCEKLGYCRVDKSVLSRIAEESGVDVKAVLEKERTVAQKPKLISDQMTSLYGRAPGAFERKSELDDKTYDRVIREAMEHYAQDGNAVIIGRGGQVILRDWPGALHVHLYAPLEARVERLMKRGGTSELEAKRRIQASDEQKRQYFRHMLHNANWKDLKHYHLAIDTSRIDPELAAGIIIEAIGSTQS